MIRDLLKQSIKNPNGGEGTGPMMLGRLMPYLDCCGKRAKFCKCATPGKLTVGYGINLDDTGLTLNEADYLLDSRLDSALRDLLVAYPWVEALDPVRQAVLLEMAYNMGLPKLRGFTQTLRSVRQGDYEEAAVEMLESLWAEQVGRRARRLAESMRTGVWQTT